MKGNDYKDYAAVHDVLYDIYNKSFSNEEIDKFVEYLPHVIKKLGEMWGWADTEFRDQAYVHWKTYPIIAYAEVIKSYESK